ncbi:MAG: hypothetical protein P4L53_11685 [Candidatus Obscuribacterales bacterium]|nr:hypothetical protein [Candidatus Obscuribacterales bacterium]
MEKCQKRLKYWRLLSGATAVVLFFALAIPAAFSENAAPAYLFKQKSEVQGQAEILVSSIGVKMTLTDRHLVIFMRPPLWHVQFCDLRSKHYFECAKEAFKEPLARTVGMTKPSSSSHLRVKSSKPTVFMGISCKSFELMDPFVSNDKKKATWEQLAVRSATAVAYDEASAKIFGRIICRVYVLPEFDALPLNVVATNYRDESSSELETTGAKKLTANVSDFVVPATCAQVSNVTGVAAENNVDANLNELFK